MPERQDDNYQYDAGTHSRSASDELRFQVDSNDRFVIRAFDSSASTNRDLLRVDPASDQTDVVSTLNFPNLTGTPSFASHDHSEGGLSIIPAGGLDLGTGLGDDGTGSTEVTRTETDTSPGFGTNITTNGLAVVKLTVTHSPDTDTATDLQASRDGGSTWTTIQTVPSAHSNKTDTVSVPITDADTLQFRDNSGSGASITIDDYAQRDIE